MHNRAIATAGRAVLPLPVGVTLVDAGEADISNGTLSWSFELAEDQQQSFTAWVRLPEAPGVVPFEARVQSGSEGSYVDQTHALLTLTTTARATLADARALAQTSHRFFAVRLWLEKAHFWLDRDRADFALASLVQASTEAMRVSHAQSAQLRWQIDDAIWSLSRQLE